MKSLSEFKGEGGRVIIANSCQKWRDPTKLDWNNW